MSAPTGGAAALFLRAHRSGALKLALMSATKTNSSGFVPTCEDDVDALSDCESGVEELITGTELELGGLSAKKDSWARSAITFIKEGKAEYRDARFMDDDDAGRGTEQLLLHAKQHKREHASVVKIRTGIRMLEEGLSGSKSELFSGTNDQAKLQGHLASALRNLG